MKCLFICFFSDTINPPKLSIYKLSLCKQRFSNKFTASPFDHIAKRLLALVVACIFSAILGCDRAEKPIKAYTISDSHIISADISNNAILLGSLENGTKAYLTQPLDKDLTTPNFKWRMQTDYSPPITALAYSEQANKAITSSGSNLVIWDTTNGQSLHHLSAPASINAIAINTQGTLAVLGLANNTANIIDLVRGGVKRSYSHQSEVLSVAIYDESWVITGQERNKAILWSLDSDEARHEMQHNDGVTLVGFSPDGKLAISASRYDKAKLWHVLDTHNEVLNINMSAMALKAGKRLIGFDFIGKDQQQSNLLLAYSDRTVDLINLKTQETLRHWTLAKKYLFAKDNTAVINLGTYQGNALVATSDGTVHILLEN